MSYESFPATPEPMPSKPVVPTSVQRATMLLLVGLGISVLSTLASFLYLDDIIDSIDNSGDLSQDALRASAIGGLIFGLVIAVAIAVFFYFFLRKGANWARILYTVLAGLSVLWSLLSLFSQPILPLLLGIVSVAITVATIVLLFRPDSNAFYSNSQGPKPGEPGFGQNSY